MSEDMCAECGRPEGQHVWLNVYELEFWRPEPGEVKKWCAKRSATKEYPTGTVKIYSPPKAVPEEPCDEEFLKEISS